MRRIVIDGQQRLTTLMILGAQIRDVVSNSNRKLADEIQDTFLINKHARSGEHKLKLVSGHRDREYFESIIYGFESNHQLEPSKELVWAREFFKAKLNELNEQLKEIQQTELNYEQLKDSMGLGFKLVTIRIENTDSPQ